MFNTVSIVVLPRLSVSGRFQSVKCSVCFTVLQVGNHDNRRITTRMGFEFADAINIILAMLPGIMVTYNGEELAMEDTFVRWEESVDPSGLLLGKDNYLSSTRDPERTPMQWDASGNAGM